MSAHPLIRCLHPLTDSPSDARAQDGDGAHRGGAAQVVAQAQPWVLHLHAVGAALDLLRHLVQHAAAAGADGVAEALESAAGVDGDRPLLPPPPPPPPPTTP